MDPGTRAAFRKLLYAIVVLFILSFAIGAANLLFTNSQVSSVRANSDGLAQANTRLNRQVIAIGITNARLTRQILADCGFYRDLAGLPIVTPPTGNPSVVVPRVISDSRAAWVGHGCPGQLPPPAPSFIKWAKFYHLPVN